MRATALFLVGVLGLLAIASADPPQVNPDDLRMVHKSLTGAIHATEPPRMLQSKAGHLLFLGAPLDGTFDSGIPAKGAVPADIVAKQFLSTHAGAFGITSPNTTFYTQGSHVIEGRGLARLGQQYGDLQVFGATVFAQTDGAGGVISITSDIMRDASLLDQGYVSLQPKLTAAQAIAQAIDYMKSIKPQYTYAAYRHKLVVFDPNVVGDGGNVALAWAIILNCVQELGSEMVVIDAHTGALLLNHSRVPDAMVRRVYDAGNTTNDPGALIRDEGSGPSLIEDVNMAYDYLGDTYNFYLTRHTRDSFDNMGSDLSVTVRYCDSAFDCPMQNAFFYPANRRMYFGQGFAVDDVVAHEYTHGVTHFSSQLAYYSESGAINESFSDVWGEYVDLTNNSGNDSPAVRWLIGEDLSIGAIRSMKNPPFYGDPEIYHGPNWFYGPEDNQGVHFNSGVGNKLCYLLTDGSSFNGYTVSGIGIDKAAAVFYRVQAVLMPPSGPYDEYNETYIGYQQYGQLLVQAAMDLQTAGQLTPAEAAQPRLAGRAVEILQFPGQPLRNFRALTSAGSPDVVLLWDTPIYTFFDRVVLVRNPNRFPTGPTDGVVVYQGRDTMFVDQNRTPGDTLYYGLFALFTDTEPVQSIFKAVLVGEDKVQPLYETFSGVPDLSYTQLLYSPVGEIDADGYTVTVTRNVSMLPHTAHNANFITLIEDAGVVAYLPQDFPFMGEIYNQIFIAENGYVAFGTSVPRSSPLNFPGGGSHLNMPRIVAFLADLSLSSGGTMWAKQLDDRAVITYDQMPIRGVFHFTNTAQIELFYSGHVRITYGLITAQNVVCGLCDGQGVIYDPLRVVETGDLVPKVVRLSQLGVPSRVTLAPIPNQFVNESDTVGFEVAAVSPGGAPSFSAFNLPRGATLTEISPTRAAFSWQTGYGDAGLHSVTIGVQEEDQVAYQRVQILVGNVYQKPITTDLRVTPDVPYEGEMLAASWNFYSAEPYLRERTRIEWYRNEGLVVPLINSAFVPGYITSPGDVWKFVLTPIAQLDNGAIIVGDPAYSPRVTVLPGAGSGQGLARRGIPDVNGDGVVNAVDVQLVINGALGRELAGAITDVNQDGKTNAIDVQIVIGATLF